MSVRKDDATDISRIRLDTNLRDVKGTVDLILERSVAIGPKVEGTYESKFGVRIHHKKYSIDVYFYDIWAEKCKFVQVGDVVIINAPHSVVHSIQRGNSNYLDNRIAAKTYVDYLLCIDASIKEQYFSVAIKSYSLSSNVTLTQVNINHIELKFRPNEAKGNTSTPPEPKRKRKIELDIDSASISMDSNLVKKHEQEPIGSNTVHKNQHDLKCKINRNSEYEDFVSPASMRLDLTLKYNSIGSLDVVSSKNAIINLMAVVMSFSPPKTTSAAASHKYSASYSIIDKSYTFPIALNIFSNDVDAFPRIHVIGDIILVHRAACGVYNQKLQLSCNTDKSSIYCIHNKSLDMITGLSSNLYSSDDTLHHKTISSTSSSISNHISSHPSISTVNNSNTISDVVNKSSSSSSVALIVIPNLSSAEWLIQSANCKGKIVSYHADEATLISELHNWAQSFLFSHQITSASSSNTSNESSAKLVTLNQLLQLRLANLNSIGALQANNPTDELNDSDAVSKSKEINVHNKADIFKYISASNTSVATLKNLTRCDYIGLVTAVYLPVSDCNSGSDNSDSVGYIAVWDGTTPGYYSSSEDFHMNPNHSSVTSSSASASDTKDLNTSINLSNSNMIKTSFGKVSLSWDISSIYSMHSLDLSDIPVICEPKIRNILHKYTKTSIRSFTALNTVDTVSNSFNPVAELDSSDFATEVNTGNEKESYLHSKPNISEDLNLKDVDVDGNLIDVESVSEDNDNNVDSLRNQLPGIALKFILVQDRNLIKFVASLALRPGLWVRFRNLHIDHSILDNITNSKSRNMFSNANNDIWTNFAGLEVASIHQDTHICPLYPFYREVRDTVASLHQLHSRREITQQPVTVRQVRSTSGQPYTPLALVLTTPAPAKFCVLASIVSWFPKDIDQFLVSKQKRSRLLFSLHIRDDTAESDVILADIDAEKFLGISTKEFPYTIQKHEEIFTKLESLRINRTLMDFYIKTYTVTSSQLSNQDSNENESDNRRYDTLDSQDRDTQEYRIDHFASMCDRQRGIKRLRVYDTSIF